MTLAHIGAVTYSYPRGAKPALKDAHLSCSESELSLVAGPSGGGKSTLLRLFNGLVPQFHGGTISGSVTVDGLDAIRTPTRQMSLSAGMVFQEPESQAVAETVVEEIAFGMEQRAVERTEMQGRVDRLLAELGIEHLRHRRQQTLSGGERQRVAIAAVLAMEPRLLLLDEPTSQLDEAGAQSLLSALLDLRRRRGLSILVSEHRLERLLPQVDRVVQVSDGAVTSLTPTEALTELQAVPPMAELCRRLGIAPTLDLSHTLPFDIKVNRREEAAPGQVLLTLDGVGVSYGEHIALREASLELREGEIVALLGPNGSGKSSMFRAITGLTRPFEGAVTFGKSGRIKSTREITRFAGLVPQDPAIALYRERVREEIAETLATRGSGATGPQIKVALDYWGLAELADRNPRDISVGQQQRVAVATMLAHQPPVWLLDEPTRGADAGAKAALAERLRIHAGRGGAAIVATHDIESAAKFATRVISLRDGTIHSDLPARASFAANGPHPTAVARLIPGAITADEVQRAGG
ncbi:MAG: ABC transporter ATP-binding protein [Dehalococcoidia bacterium]